MACEILVPRPGIKPTFSALEGGFLTTGEPGKSHIIYFLKALFTIRTTNTVEASETHGEVMLLRRFLWLFLSQAPTPEAVRAGVGQRPCVSISAEWFVRIEDPVGLLSFTLFFLDVLMSQGTV